MPEPVDIRATLARRHWDRAVAQGSVAEAARAYAAMVDAGAPECELAVAAATVALMAGRRLSI